jgi:hypothetical protein
LSYLVVFDKTLPTKKISNNCKAIKFAAPLWN